METIRQYLLSVTTAAIICGIANSLANKNGAHSAVVKLISGLFLAITVISPLAKLQISDFSSFAEGLSVEAGESVNYGQDMALEAIAAIIKSETESYILDKAASMNTDLEVCVTVSETDPPQPTSVTLKGAVSPYVKGRLQQIITDDLGIREEDQQWI